MKEQKKSIWIGLSPDDLTALDELASRLRLSRAALARQLIVAGIETHTHMQRTTRKEAS